MEPASVGIRPLLLVCGKLRDQLSEEFIFRKLGDPGGRIYSGRIAGSVPVAYA